MSPEKLFKIAFALYVIGNLMCLAGGVLLVMVGVGAL